MLTGVLCLAMEFSLKAKPSLCQLVYRAGSKYSPLTLLRGIDKATAAAAAHEEAGHPLCSDTFFNSPDNKY